MAKIVGDQVYLRNPWGAQEDGAASDGPNRQLVDGEGTIVMSVSDFQARLLGASIPSAAS